MDTFTNSGLPWDDYGALRDETLGAYVPDDETPGRSRSSIKAGPARRRASRTWASLPIKNWGSTRS